MSSLLSLRDVFELVIVCALVFIPVGIILARWGVKVGSIFSFRHKRMTLKSYDGFKELVAEKKNKK